MNYLYKIDKSKINELKAIRMPNQIILTILTAMMHLLGIKVQ